MIFQKVYPLVTYPVIHEDRHVNGSAGSGIQYFSAQILSRSAKNWFENGTISDPTKKALIARAFFCITTCS